MHQHQDVQANHATVAAGRSRLDLRHITFPSPRAFNRPLNLAPGAASAMSALLADSFPMVDSGEHEPSFPDWLFRRVGLDPHSYKSDSLARRLPACLRALRVDATPRARSLLRRRPELLPFAIDAALVGVTEFFRDPEVFETLARDVLPALLRDAAARQGPLRVWSAGCSDGRELYSVAMLLADLGVTSSDRAQLLGTDARSGAADAARDGRFCDEAAEPLPSRFRERHMTRDASVAGAGWRISDGIRGMTEWRTGNLLSQTEPGPWDLILCRNVAIYLRPEASARLWHSLVARLRPGGYLVLGRAERPTGVRGLQQTGPCIWRADLRDVPGGAA